jgi:Aspartyl protease
VRGQLRDMLFALCLSLALVEPAGAQRLSSEDEGAYIIALDTVHLRLGVTKIYALLYVEGYHLPFPGQIEAPTLRELKDQDLIALATLKQDLRTSIRILEPGPDYPPVPNPLARGWAGTALAGGRDLAEQGIRVIEAYEHAYDQPSHRRLRLEARGLNCSFLNKADTLLITSPQMLVERGMIARARYEDWVAKNDVLLDQVSSAKKWICAPVAGAVIGREMPQPASPSVKEPPLGFQNLLDQEKRGLPKAGGVIHYTPGHPIIAVVKLNGGRSTARLILDTGADGSMVKPALLASAGVNLVRPAARGDASGITGKVKVSYFTVDFEVAGHRARVTHVAAFNRYDDDFADGLLGRDFLDRFKVVMDPAAGTVTLVPR